VIFSNDDTEKNIKFGYSISNLFSLFFFLQVIFSNADTEKNIKFGQFAKVQQLAAKSKNGSGLKPGATMVPQVKGMASVVDPSLSHLM